MSGSARLPSIGNTAEDNRGSQLPILLLLNGYAAAGALFISRALLRALEISDRYWVGRQIFRATNPFASILEIIPGASREFTGALTMADLTLVIGVVLLQLGILGFGGRRR